MFDGITYYIRHTKCGRIDYRVMNYKTKEIGSVGRRKIS